MMDKNVDVDMDEDVTEVSKFEDPSNAQMKDSVKIIAMRIVVRSCPHLMHT